MKINRRNFTKTLIGFFGLPVGLSFGKNRKKKIKNNYVTFEVNNIKCNGTFDEYINSIYLEIKRILSVESNEPDTEQWSQEFNIQNINCGTNATITFNAGEDYSGIYTYFSIDKIEFDRNGLKGRRFLAHSRFIDCIWSLYNRSREDYVFLKKLGIDPSKPLDN